MEGSAAEILQRFQLRDKNSRDISDFSRYFNLFIYLFIHSTISRVLWKPV
jgi:hypothetical protein